MILKQKFENYVNMCYNRKDGNFYYAVRKFGGITSEKYILLGGSIMNIEKKIIDAWNEEKGIIGHITLDKLAIPETVKVTVDGNEFVPAVFDCYGHPFFTEEQERIYMCKANQFLKKNGTPLYAEVCYEEKTFDVPRYSFDTVKGIQECIKSFEDLKQMIDNRKMYCKINKKERLNEFVLFGYFLLDEFGQVLCIENIANSGITSLKDVIEFETFKNITQEGFSFVYGGETIIPKENSVCPCCGKKITLEELKKQRCLYKKGKFYHDDCYMNYIELFEIDKLTYSIMDQVYGSENYEFEVIPDGYVGKDRCSNIPWLLFHTKDGDIVIGWKKNVISIEWQKNYKSFSMKKLFDSEMVIKWDGEKKGIHASSNEKAREYLRKVMDVVNL